MSARADLSRIIPSFTVYKFMSTLVQPFTQFDAYKLGIIDSKGNFKKKFKELKTQKERKAASMFFRIIINLKKLHHLKVYWLEYLLKKKNQKKNHHKIQ